MTTCWKENCVMFSSTSIILESGNTPSLLKQTEVNHKVLGQVLQVSANKFYVSFDLFMHLQLCPIYRVAASFILPAVQETELLLKVFSEPVLSMVFLIYVGFILMVLQISLLSSVSNVSCIKFDFKIQCVLYMSLFFVITFCIPNILFLLNICQKKLKKYF